MVGSRRPECRIARNSRRLGTFFLRMKRCVLHRISLICVAILYQLIVVGYSIQVSYSFVHVHKITAAVLLSTQKMHCCAARLQPKVCRIGCGVSRDRASGGETRRRYVHNGCVGVGPWSCAPLCQGGGAPLPPARPPFPSPQPLPCPVFDPGSCGVSLSVCSNALAAQQRGHILRPACPPPPAS